MHPRTIMSLSLLVRVVAAACDPGDGVEPVHAGGAPLELATSKPCQLTELAPTGLEETPNATF